MSIVYMYVSIMFIYTQYGFLFIVACVLSVLFVHWSFMRDPKIFEGGGGRSKDNFVCLKCGVGMAGRRPSFKNIMWKFDFF